MPVDCPNAELELLQADARSASWLVLVAPLPFAQKTALLEAAAAGGRPVLLIDPQLELEADLAAQLALEAPPTLLTCSELLAAEDGEQSWYLYNDRRRNGTAEPDGLLPYWPNLRLEGTEMRTTRRLDAVLSTWLEQAAVDGRQAGLLWLPATQAPHVLAGAGVFLDRLETIWLGGALPNDGLDVELVERLEASCHRLEREGPNHQVWRLDGHRLVERELLLVTKQREALQARCEELQGQLIAQVAQMTEQSQQREMLHIRVEELDAQLSMQVLQNADFNHQREGLLARVEELQDQCDRLILENTQAAKERDQELSSRREEARSQFETLSAQRDGMQHERDQLSAERDTLEAEKERMEMERQQILVALEHVFPFEAYKDQRVDLRQLDDGQLIEHFVSCGINENVDLRHALFKQRLEDCQKQNRRLHKESALIRQELSRAQIHMDLLKDLIVATKP